MRCRRDVLIPETHQCGLAETLRDVRTPQASATRADSIEPAVAETELDDQCFERSEIEKLQRLTRARVADVPFLTEASHVA